MDVVSSPSDADTYPLLNLMERAGHVDAYDGTQHVIDITGTSEDEERGRSIGIISGARLTVSQPSVSVSLTNGNGSNSRNSSFLRRGGGGGGGDSRNSRHRSPFNSGLWISVELALLVCQIVASGVVLSLSRHEHPRNPLFAWIVGYACGCVATLPLLYWRYYHHNHIRDRDRDRDQGGSLSHSRQNSTQINNPSGTRTNGVENDQASAAAAASSSGNQPSWLMNGRLKALLEYFKISLDCFFAVWFVVGNVWIFGGHSSVDEAPNLYRLCVVFLTLSCIGYAMPFILCATICCCLPCIISILGVREDLTQTRGATSDSINALPTYKFKMKKNKGGGESNSAGEGGIIAAGTERERVISGEDAVCCICLAKYENNDELRELPCSHLHHKDCVDKWLKINALCPLCKSEVGENFTGLVSGEVARQQRGEH